MKLETVKSFMLTILVGLSLLLTFSIWSYQPDVDRFISDQYVDEVDIGGIEETKKRIIEPSSILFHTNNEHYGFTDAINRRSLYQDMQSWILYEFATRSTDEPPSSDHQVEVIFPDALPMEFVNSLFTFNEEQQMPSWSFQRIFITLNQDSQLLTIYFQSTNGQQQARAVVNNSSKYDMLWNYMTNLDDLTSYVVFGESEESGTPIYIPENPVTMARLSFTVESIEPSLFVNELFNTPSIVGRNISNVNEAYYTDAQRGMRVYQDQRMMEFINPNESSPDQLGEPISLVERSISNINDHKGWTNEYNLVSIDTTMNRVRYQMYYEGIPVFNNLNLSIIEQEWRGQELNFYQRPLFNFNTGNIINDGGTVDLLSGRDVIYILQNNANVTYNLENIRDIQIGYKLEYEDSADRALTLEPAWYMNYSGNWIELDFSEYEELKGGS
ncbi:YycH family regulatory protein [Virgibacillus byunsanensis]|uniref:YycH family regulatory protein n=1 Tax=Virgibacillus byunsanensis TaxID=570945 RepID=A0ABW3LR43_9BACI